VFLMDIEHRIELMKKFLYIPNKQREVVSFVPNNVQSYFLFNKGHRNIITKARQLGISSSELADMFVDCVTTPNTTCVVTSHEQHATERLLEKVHFFIDNFPYPKPETHHLSASEISFPKMNSTIYIGTARSMTFGRGDKIDRAHLSELSFYDDGERILNAIEDAVPLTGEITIECTPNGEDNEFYRGWTRAKEGKSSYKPFFFPWWLGLDYRIERGSDLALPEDRGDLTPTPEEVLLIDKYGITEDQLRWRRRKIADKQGFFWQEYPEDEVTCFITAGQPVFNATKLAQLAKECYPGVRMPNGWKEWLPPKEGSKYVIGVDCTEGIHDYAAFVVLDVNYNVCATYQALMPPKPFAELLFKIGARYNNALLAVERNAPGYGVLAHLIGYGNLYHQKDYTTGKPTARVGWWTSGATKRFMEDTMKEVLGTGEVPALEFTTWDSSLVRQMRAYRVVKGKNTSQTYDDLLMAAMIAVAVRFQSGGSRGYRGTTKMWNW